MLNYEVNNEGYEQFKKDLNSNDKDFFWFKSELEFLENFVKENVNREIALQQVIILNKKYKTRLSLGKSKLSDESGELTEFIVSDSFKNRINTKDTNVAISLINDFRKAAKARGRDLLSFASKYCHHCNPNMFPIYDSENVEYLKNHYSYKDKKDYSEYIDVYNLFCKSIGVDLENAVDNKEGFYVDKFINNLEKSDKIHEGKMSTTFLSEETTRYFEDQWIAHQLKELSNGRYWFLNESQFGICKKEFWSIVSDEKWGDVSFHFELKWKQGVPMTEASKLNIYIHLETKKGREELYQKAREYFKERGYVFKDDVKEGAFLAPDGSKLKESITPDFSSEETANNTIKEIIKILDSDAYQQCAKIADECIEKIYGKAK